MLYTNTRKQHHLLTQQEPRLKACLRKLDVIEKYFLLLDFDFTLNELFTDYTLPTKQVLTT